MMSFLFAAARSKHHAKAEKRTKTAHRRAELVKNKTMWQIFDQMGGAVIKDF
jgi:hypothetical protein